MGNDDETKELLDLMLRTIEHEEELPEDEEVTDDRLVQASLEGYRKESDRIQSEQECEGSAWLLAASEKPCGKTNGVAVDAGAQRGTIMECSAQLEKRGVLKGEIEVSGKEVTRIERGGDTLDITPPLACLREKLRDIFLHNDYLQHFHLYNCESKVEIVPKKGDLTVIMEAKSLELAVIIALISAVVGRPMREDILFSASVRLDGSLRSIGDLKLKLKTAEKAGIKEVILPKENEAEYNRDFAHDPPPFSVKFFSHISQVTQYLELPYEAPAELRGEESKSLWRPSPAPSAKAKIAKKGAELGISENTILEIMEVAEDLAQMRNERNPVSTALVVGDTEKIKNLLPPAEVRLRKGGRIINLTARLGLLSSLVNGEDLGFVVNENGVVDSIRKFNIDLRGDYGLSPLLGWMDHKCALISKVTDSIVFYLTPSSNRIHLFCSGEFIAKFINATWCTTDLADLENMLGAIVSDKGYDRDTVNRVARCALRMSWLNLGGLFAVFSADTDLEGKTDDRLTMYGLAFSPKPLEDLTDEDLINLAKEDGATLIDGKGFLRSFMCFLRPTSRVELDFELGAGSRRINAQRFSYEANCLTVVVSEDGGVSFFSDGKRVFRT